jgi:hypothetical protein
MVGTPHNPSSPGEQQYEKSKFYQKKGMPVRTGRTVTVGKLIGVLDMQSDQATPKSDMIMPAC